jgi:hypothetical protein
LFHAHLAQPTVGSGMARNANSVPPNGADVQPTMVVIPALMATFWIPTPRLATNAMVTLQLAVSKRPSSLEPSEVSPGSLEPKNAQWLEANN